MCWSEYQTKKHIFNRHKYFGFRLFYKTEIFVTIENVFFCLIYR